MRVQKMDPVFGTCKKTKRNLGFGVRFLAQFWGPLFRKKTHARNLVFFTVEKLKNMTSERCSVVRAVTATLAGGVDVALGQRCLPNKTGTTGCGQLLSNNQ